MKSSKLVFIVYFHAIFFILSYIIINKSPNVQCQSYNQYGQNDLSINRFNHQGQDNIDNNDNDEDQQQYGGGAGGPPESFIVQSSSASSSLSSAAAALSNQLVNHQCELVNFDFCSSMPFNFTRMPNIFGDKNQIEASERSQQYKSLVQTNCSPRLLDYLCEMLAPICFNDKNMKKFEVYPCRSFCRSVKQDCERELKSLFHVESIHYHTGALPKAFDCDLLPYESQSGSGKSNGPCHDELPTKPQQQHQQQHQQQQPASVNTMKAPMNANNYWPYQPENHQNIPAFITDTSSLDLERLTSTSTSKQKPASSNSQDKTRATTGLSNSSNNTQLVGQLHSYGLSLWVTLWKYSNLISIITLICLLMILNARRLNRAKLRLFDCLSSSRQSSSSNSSNSSQRKLAIGGGGGGGSTSLSGYPSIGGGGAKHQINVHQVTMSPSSSSRSLMLFAGGSGKAQSKLVSGSSSNGEPLMIGQPHLSRAQFLAHQPTLINVEGTFERLNKNHQNRYHQHQQLLDQQQHQHQHEYDYIQVQQPSKAASNSSSSSTTAATAALASTSNNSHNHLYKNILLSSPSHQVLLCGADGGGPPPPSSNSIRRAGDSPAIGPSVPPPATPQSFHPYLTSAAGPASLPSPYASPFTYYGNQQHQQHQQQQQHMQPMSLAFDANYLNQQHNHQRSFSRRRAGGGTSRSCRNSAGQSQQAYAASSSSAASSTSAGGSGNSSSSSFSPPAATGQQPPPVASARQRLQ